VSEDPPRESEQLPEEGPAEHVVPDAEGERERERHEPDQSRDPEDSDPDTATGNPNN
jgi:hypothetical protein